MERAAASLHAVSGLSLPSLPSATDTKPACASRVFWWGGGVSCMLWESTRAREAKLQSQLQTKQNAGVWGCKHFSSYQNTSCTLCSFWLLFCTSETYYLLLSRSCSWQSFLLPQTAFGKSSKIYTLKSGRQGWLVCFLPGSTVVISSEELTLIATVNRHKCTDMAGKLPSIRRFLKVFKWPRSF